MCETLYCYGLPVFGRRSYVKELWTYAEQAADSTLYQELGFTEGAYYYNEDGAYCQHEKILFNYQLPIMGIERTYFLFSTCSTINAPISSREIAKLIFTSP